MATKIYSIGTLLIILASTVFSTCRKGSLDCASARYSFEIAASITPDKDSIHIGDTIILKVHTPTTLYDLQSGRSIDYKNAMNLGNVITFLKFLPANRSTGAINNFSLSIEKGTKVKSIDPQSQLEVLFFEDNGNYLFDLSIVPRDTGRYVITIGNAANVYRRNDNCTKANFIMDFQNTNQHLYFLNLWRPDLAIDGQGKKKVYYFKVY
jgi:hypothetical protein